MKIETNGQHKFEGATTSLEVFPPFKIFPYTLGKGGDDEQKGEYNRRQKVSISI